MPSFFEFIFYHGEGLKKRLPTPHSATTHCQKAVRASSVGSGLRSYRERLAAYFFGVVVFIG